MTKKLSRFRFLLHNKTLFKTILRRFDKKDNFDTYDDEQNHKAKYIFNYKFDCKNPKTFNEHLVWLKLHYHNDLWCKCADKLGSKEFLSEIGLDEYLPKTYGIYKNSSEIDLSKLPDKFVLKTNHDCGTVFVCDKSKSNFNQIFKQLDSSLLRKYSEHNHEWVYEKISPKIFAEELLIPAKNNELIDYKFFMIGGNFAFGFTGQNRNVDTRFTLFDEKFSPINSEYIYLKPSKKDWPCKPDCWDEMMSIAHKVGSHFEFVRVDLYYTIAGPRIGELTFFSQSGLGPFTNKDIDYKYGRLFSSLNIFKID